MRLRPDAAAIVVLSATSCAGCAGAQSALDPAGRAAERIAGLFWGMTIGAAFVWLAVVILALYAAYFARAPLSTARGRMLIVVGGVVTPTLLLGGLLAYGLSLLPELLEPAPSDALRVEVTGYQWWWRVRYLREGGAPVELANEIRVPRGRAVELQLAAHDVIHSFWVPALGGKMDMIPGRRTRLLLRPTRTGIFPGVCAEYCGSSHALMRFYAVVEERSAFDRWLARQAQPAVVARDGAAARGQVLFVAHGCGACHTVRGTTADGVIAPDLTHVGSRISIGAGILTADRESFRRFVARTGELKPSVHMPSFGVLPPGDLEALAAYLESLQ
jgi:cytochrome c oxidase subunit 2